MLNYVFLNGLFSEKKTYIRINNLKKQHTETKKH